MAIWFLTLILSPTIASGEVLLVSGALFHGSGFVEREIVRLLGWQLGTSGARGTITVESRRNPISVSFEVNCAMGEVEWRSDDPVGKATAEGGVVTRVDVMSDLTAIFADGEQAFFPPRNGDPDLAITAGYHEEDGFRSRRAGEAENLEATGAFLAERPAIAYALTMQLMARACAVD